MSEHEGDGGMEGSSQDQPTPMNTPRNQIHASKRRFWLRLSISFAALVLLVIVILVLLTYFEILPPQWFVRLLASLVAVFGLSIGAFVKGTLSDKDFQQSFGSWLRKRLFGDGEGKTRDGKDASTSAQATAQPNITINVSPSITNTNTNAVTPATANTSVQPQSGYGGSPLADEASGHVKKVLINGQVKKIEISSQQSERRKVRIFTSLGRDVSDEKKRLEDKVIGKLNQGVQLSLEVLDWHSYVDQWEGRPLQDIFNQLRIGSRDIFVGVLWHHFTGPYIGNDLETGKVFRVGTQGEFSLAYELWQQKRRPRILIYHCKRRPSLDQIDTDQLECIRQFLAAGLIYQGLLKSYTQPVHFEQYVLEDLEALLLKDSSPEEVSLIGRFSSESELSAGLKSSAWPFVESTADKQQDLSLRPRPKPPELGSVSSGESIKDPQDPLSPEVSDIVKNRLRPEKPPEKLFGRQEELEKARRYVLNGELPLLVYGIPGIGKTAFLATLFDDPEVKKIYSGGDILWINLRENEDSSGDSPLTEIVDEIARGWSYRDVLNEKTLPNKFRRLKSTLSHDLRAHVIVFDNVDLETQQRALLNFRKEIATHIVVGSRARFDLPGAQEISIRKLAPTYAIDAFKSYARSTTDDDERIGEICELIDYHPQAIKIAASAMYDNRLSLEELARQLKNKRQELMNQRSEDDFEFNMHVSFGVAYDNLSVSGGKYVFDVFGTFAPSGAPLAAIADASRFHEDECEPLLAQLQSRSLIERDEQDPNHYRMHQLLYDFAREKLKDMKS
jgi:hypothetical protein